MDRLSHAERVIYDLLVSKAKDKGYCKLAYDTIARYTRMDVDMVRACIRGLERMGFIRKELVPNSSNRYWIVDMPVDVPEPEPVVMSVWVPEPKHYLFA